MIFSSCFQRWRDTVNLGAESGQYQTVIKILYYRFPEIDRGCVCEREREEKENKQKNPVNPTEKHYVFTTIRTKYLGEMSISRQQHRIHCNLSSEIVSVSASCGIYQKMTTDNNQRTGESIKHDERTQDLCKMNEGQRSRVMATGSEYIHDSKNW